MGNRRWILFLLSSTMISLLAGCGNSGSNFNPQNPPPPPAATVSIAFKPAPPTSVLINSSTPVTAVVSNDASNAGVNWVLTCNTANCGTLSVDGTLTAHTNSGQAIMYTPPATLPGNTEIVNIAGFATADPAKNVLASINVSAFANNLSGPFVFQAQGVDTGLNPFQIAGVVFLDGNGGIIPASASGQQASEETLNYVDSNGNFASEQSPVPINNVGSSYFIGPDGRGSLTLVPRSSQIGIEVFDLVYLSPTQVLIVPTSIAGSGITGSGTMVAQTWTASTPSLSGPYSFVLSGSDFNGQGATVFGGIFNIDLLSGNPNNISGANSIADQYFDSFGTLAPFPAQKLLGTISSPDLSGAVTLSLTPHNTFETLTFTGYIVDATGTQMRLIETDSGGAGWVDGVAIAQSATGNTNNFSGTYVFGVGGVDVANFGSPSGNPLPTTLTSAGVVTASGGSPGTLTGYMDTAFQSLTSPTTGLPVQISSSFAGMYSTGSFTGVGRFHSTFNKFPSPNGTFGPTYIFYLTGNGNVANGIPDALILAAGNFNVNTGTGYPFLGAGAGYTQSMSLSLNGNYGFGLIQQNGSENDDLGLMAANSTLTGVADVNSSLTGFIPDSPFTGTFTPSSNGVFPATITGGTNSSGSNSFLFSPFAADFYIIDPGHGFFVETDLFNQITAGATPTVSFGYYAPQTLPQPPGSSEERHRR